jgi:hypothetical protein
MPKGPQGQNRPADPVSSVIAAWLGFIVVRNARDCEPDTSNSQELPITFSSHGMPIGAHLVYSNWCTVTRLKRLVKAKSEAPLEPSTRKRTD